VNEFLILLKPFFFPNFTKKYSRKREVQKIKMDSEAAKKAIKTVDYCTRELVNHFTSLGGAVIITADHGNAEEMLNEEDNSINTEHSINPVPFILSGTDVSPRVLPYGSLSDVAPTVLQLMGIQQPSEMNGRSLIKMY